jgi:hyaluronate lyase
MLPGASLEATRDWASSDAVEIVTHTDATHAVRLPHDAALLAHFWSPGCAGELKATGRCCVLVREHGDRRATIVVSDPARENRSLGVCWHRRVARVISAPRSLSRSETGDRLCLTFEGLDTAAGAPQEITVELAGEERA